MIYAKHAPRSWITPEGFPLSWRHYCYGMAFIARENLRSQLHLAQAQRMAGVVQDDWNIWQRDIERVTEVPRGG